MSMKFSLVFNCNLCPAKGIIGDKEGSESFIAKQKSELLLLSKKIGWITINEDMHICGDCIKKILMHIGSTTLEEELKEKYRTDPINGEVPMIEIISHASKK